MSYLPVVRPAVLQGSYLHRVRSTCLVPGAEPNRSAFEVVFSKHTHGGCIRISLEHPQRQLSKTGSRAFITRTRWLSGIAIGTAERGDNLVQEFLIGKLPRRGGLMSYQPAPEARLLSSFPTTYFVPFWPVSQARLWPALQGCRRLRFMEARNEWQ